MRSSADVATTIMTIARLSDMRLLCSHSNLICKIISAQRNITNNCRARDTKLSITAPTNLIAKLRAIMRKETQVSLVVIYICAECVSFVVPNN